MSAVGIRRITTTLVTDLTAQIVSARADQMGAWLDRRMEELALLVRSARLADRSEEERVAEVRRFAADHDEHFESVGLVRPDGTVLVSDGSVINIAERPYFQAMRDNRLDRIVSAPIVSRSDESPIIVLLRRTDGVTVSGAILLSSLSRIAATIEVRGYPAWIVDRDGGVVAHPDAARRMVTGVTDATGVADATGVTDAADATGVTDAADVTGGSMRGSLPENQTDGLVTIGRPLPHTDGWRLVVALPETVFRRDVRSTVRTLVGIYLVVAAVAVAVSVWLAGSLSRPIRRLQGFMFSAERGDLAVRAPARRRDEIGRLERSFNNMLGRVEVLMGEVRRQQRTLRRKELDSMYQQIKPHFLYNSLDSIRWMADDAGQDDLRDMVDALARVFRLSLSDGAEFIPLEDELEQARSYLTVQQMRYTRKFTFSFSVDRDVGGLRVAKLIVQPLVENALYHGVRSGEADGWISVKAAVRGDHLEISVADSGPGFSGGARRRWASAESDGYGLRNVHERLRLHFGEPFGIRLDDATRRSTAHEETGGASIPDDATDMDGPPRTPTGASGEYTVPTTVTIVHPLLSHDGKDAMV